MNKAFSDFSAQVSLDLHFQAQKVILRLSDDGCGFELETLPRDAWGLGSCRMGQATNRSRQLGCNIWPNFP